MLENSEKSEGNHRKTFIRIEVIIKFWSFIEYIRQVKVAKKIN
jgi:hypothetical protein